ncbi:MAG: helix-turn-helix transcriptional regulator [Rhodococcus sp. (in: high G+C Gram-positive bacteria)]|uniref:response regulator transcription factor n=1 Tax=Rhodococcus sp. TaxID=1831 RepID=UPI003BB4B0CC
MTPPDIPSTFTTAPRSPALSTREIQVLTTWLMCDSKHDVAQQLFISVTTVQTHLTRIRTKYEAANRP